MVIAPNTNIILLKVPLSLDNKNQITFTNKQAQYNYFMSLPHLTLENATYQRKDGYIRFDKSFDQLIEYNYVMYQNNEYVNNKWFYAYITNMEYKNNETTYIYIKSDVWQTWQFDIIFKQSFVEREMINVSEDVPGANLLPENLETGEYKIGGTAEFDELEPVWAIAFLGNEIGGVILGNGGYIANGMANSISFLFCTNLESYNLTLGVINEKSDGDKIMTCFAIPRLAVNNFLINDFQTNIPNCYAYISGNEFNQPAITKTLLALPNNLDGYIPKNQKLRTYPYMYLGFNPTNRNIKNL